ncbi:hypothetical protein NCS52_01590400 [Fusarium sp. LHS14.1]|nr:hypothetical protein NCS52_01590400 [Fusarium sp. LHS14.1]
MTSLQHPLSPTFEGYVSSGMDALILFEASLSGRLNHSPRQIHDCERNYLIRSGNVFIYEMQASGIRHWKDGIFWTSDLVPDEEGFLVYYELESPSLLEKNARTTKEGEREQQSNSKPANWRPNNALSVPSAMVPNSTIVGDTPIEPRIASSYIKPHGLLKKTCSVSFQGIPHHLVSYYSVDDVTNGHLVTPTKDPNLRAVIPRSGLVIHKPSSLSPKCVKESSATASARPGGAMTPNSCVHGSILH